MKKRQPEGMKGRKGMEKQNFFALLFRYLSKYKKVNRKEGRATMEQEIDILIQYGKADMGKRLHLFLQFPDLRRGFQEIERKKLAAQSGSASLRKEHIKEKCPRSVALLGAAYR